MVFVYTILAEQIPVLPSQPLTRRCRKFSHPTSFPMNFFWPIIETTWIAFGNTTSSVARTTPDSKARVIVNEGGSIVTGEWISTNSFSVIMGRFGRVPWSAGEIASGSECTEHGSYSEIYPTNSHNSAHPMGIGGVPSFNLQQADGETVSTVGISEITTGHLIRLRDSASEFLGRKVTGAVITVPTDFSNTQKEALVVAATAGELEVLRIIHEPVAAVLAALTKNILVADLGVTRCDAAVVASRGQKLDEVLVDHFSKDFIKKHKVDPGNERSLAKLRLEAGGTKRTLSLGTSASISIELGNELSAKVFDQIVSLVENVVKKAELGPFWTLARSGACKSPETLTTVLHPSELSAYGASIQASLIAEFDKEDIEQSTHSAVTVAPHLSHPIGVIIGEDNSFRTMPEAQTAIPAQRIAQFDVQSNGDVVVRICGGYDTIKVGLNLDLNVAVRGEVKPEAGSEQ
ncbi:Hsp70 protein-domain-containing protein [Tuber brumale]|nr:Hsp70 protein-domain-containing protein [Tuber brumale]